MSAEGDVLAVGANEVPKRGGGLYWPTDEGDNRDLARKHDSNATIRRALMKKVAEELGESSVEAFVDKLERTSLRNLTEYGRAVHAEMEAIMSCARTGRSVRGATMYVTTFPCHSCARHIIASGIKRVVYVEPYPKSRAVGNQGHGTGRAHQAREGTGEEDQGLVVAPTRDDVRTAGTCRGGAPAGGGKAGTAIQWRGALARRRAVADRDRWTWSRRQAGVALNGIDTAQPAKVPGHRAFLLDLTAGMGSHPKVG